MRKHALAFVLSSPILLRADEQHQHFDANEMLGTVSFPISCAVGVQKPFERGVGCCIRSGTGRGKRSEVRNGLLGAGHELVSPALAPP
jgi:hypothetical protein